MANVRVDASGDMMYKPRRSGRKTPASTTSSLKTFGFRVQKNPQSHAAKTNSALPAVERQSLRIAVANSIETDRLHKLANPSADPRDAATTTRPNTRSRSSSFSAIRHFTRSSKSAAAMAPLTRGAMPNANNTQHRGTAAGINHDKKKKKKAARQDMTKKNRHQTKLDFSHAEVTRGGATQYLVEWDGTDPSTGMAWPADWLGVSDLTKPALQAWEAKKADGMGEPARK
ncbi:hypothetical protein PG994_003256 [Apiospora phragmitis]|uniref:Chromo domain-containing protein n=1 Tax=Apiospora phragmitis TaxID=2905665 RepID=A0ABR1VXM6_9PEZI